MFEQNDILDNITKGGFVPGVMNCSRRQQRRRRSDGLIGSVRRRRRPGGPLLSLIRTRAGRLQMKEKCWQWSATTCPASPRARARTGRGGGARSEHVLGASSTAALTKQPNCPALGWRRRGHSTRVPLRSQINIPRFFTQVVKIHLLRVTKPHEVIECKVY